MADFVKKGTDKWKLAFPEEKNLKIMKDNEKQTG